MPIPQEFTIGGVYLPPLLIAALLGLAATSLTARLLDRYHLSRYFAHPPLVLISLCVLYTLLIGTLFIGI
ncbi:DUF1656 domain-containing protein [Microbulbifer hainanensis]|uniref:DUF1656 domain-containing protein n=1 Tax=Microbulbifer hainanensis TaxID=2735675 RepID=UPI0018687FA0|nr:DUF1656 domain-containing protein [Microbulbifer hainanensis]